jgi:hypothetical protein
MRKFPKVTSEMQVSFVKKAPGPVLNGHQKTRSNGVPKPEAHLKCFGTIPILGHTVFEWSQYFMVYIKCPF